MGEQKTLFVRVYETFVRTFVTANKTAALRRLPVSQVLVRESTYQKAYLKAVRYPSAKLDADAVFAIGIQLSNGDTGYRSDVEDMNAITAAVYETQRIRMVAAGLRHTDELSTLKADLPCYDSEDTYPEEARWKVLLKRAL